MYFPDRCLHLFIPRIKHTYTRGQFIHFFAVNWYFVYGSSELHHLQHKDYVINVGIYMIICTQGIHIYFIITLLLLSLPNHYVDYITNSFSRLNILRGLFIVLSWHVFMCVCCVCVIYLFDWQPNQLQNLLSVISVCRLVIFEAWMRWITYTPCQLKELNG